MSENYEDMIPEGYYEAVAVKTQDEGGGEAYARFALTKAGNRQVAAHFKILNPPEGVSVKYPLPWYGAFSSTPMGKKGKTVAQVTVESLRAMGLKGNDLAAAQDQDLDQLVSVMVEHNEWDGKVRPRIAFVNTPGGGAIKLNNPMPLQEVRKFAAMMRDSLGKVPEVGGTRVASQAPAAEQASHNTTSAPVDDQPPPPEEDDIPF
jgi:hypothetical protein